jgi:hypothetical protein
MVHHTASHASPGSDVGYMVDRADTRPIANLYLARDGVVYVLAAGPTNTNGAGSWPGVPDDRMNAYAVGIEAGNDGVGEPWPPAQQDAYVKAAAAICTAYRIPVGNVLAHREWAPSRKIDPAGPSRWAGPSGRWDMDAFRGDVLMCAVDASRTVCPACHRPL